MHSNLNPKKPKKIKTPDKVKTLFKEFLFPTENKKSAVPKGMTWKKTNPQTKVLYRSTNALQCGFDCAHANIVVVDIDSYKESFKKSKEAQDFAEQAHKHSQISYSTPSGGQHIFFKVPPGIEIKDSKPFDCIEIKGSGYVVMYDMPCPYSQATLNTFQDFHDILPVYPFLKPQAKKKIQTDIKFGKGLNNKAIAHRAGRAGSNQDFEQAENDLVEMIDSNKNRPDWNAKQHIKDYFLKFKSSLFYKTNQLIEPELPGHTFEEKKIIKKETEDMLTKGTQFKNIDVEIPTAFIQNLLLHYDFNFVGGPLKAGKSRAIITLLQQQLSAQKNEDKAIILSTENNKNSVLKPLIKQIKGDALFIHIPDKASQYFDETAKTQKEKLSIYLTRIDTILKRHPQARVLLLDPLARFIDWNNEILVTTFIDTIRDIALARKVCVIGLRNDGKQKGFDSVHLTKGSTALTDISRQILRALPCHPKSALGKKCAEKDPETKKKTQFKSLVLYTERSSLFKDVAFLFKIRIFQQKHKGKTFPVAVAEKVEELKQSISIIKWMCEAKSGKSDKQKIVEFIQSQSPQQASLSDLQEHFEGSISADNYKRILYDEKHFDRKTVGGITYFFPVIDGKPQKNTENPLF